MGLRIVRRKLGSCGTGKVWYGSELEAKAALHLMPRKSRRKECRAYRCDRCSGWHLTSRAAP